MHEQNAQTQDLRRALSDSTTWSTIAIFLILICFFIYLTTNSRPDPHAGASIVESLKDQFSQRVESPVTGTALHQTAALRTATDLLTAAGGQKAVLRDDVTGDIRLTFPARDLFEPDSSALTANGAATVAAVAAALKSGAGQLRADVLLPPQGEVLTALDSVRIAVMASTLEVQDAPMGRVRLGLAASGDEGLVVGLGIVEAVSP